MTVSGSKKRRCAQRGKEDGSATTVVYAEPGTTPADAPVASTSDADDEQACDSRRNDGVPEIRETASLQGAER